ncbi:sulfate adenylyltransferase subunit 2 [Xenorhabdus cabanillasii]|uniref:Sulfate adenylyltransferase subunit 2 n=2 Tax=Xenorhabdus cabanillasii TaxID=351673 RepID=A0A3D9UPR2_9GAMM|nr:sulfate adenylyltransferase subunit 2 [Xenorhabdus cabanillasii]
MEHIKTKENPFWRDGSQKVWDTDLTYEYMQQSGQVDRKKTAEQRLKCTNILPVVLSVESLRDEQDRQPTRLVLEWAIKQARKRRDRVLFIQLNLLPDGKPYLHANDARGEKFSIPIETVSPDTIRQALVALQQHIGKAIAVFPHAKLVHHTRHLGELDQITTCPQAYQPVLTPPAVLVTPNRRSIFPSAHLKRLETESIDIIREALAEAQNPAMLYSLGKDSSVMLHLAKKAFYPSIPPFSLLHVDTRWKFQEMYQFRDLVAYESGMELLVYINPEAIEKNINPFDHGSALHTDITKTEGLKQALDHYKFDVVFGGARRDEEKSRAKERVFSFRTAAHRWDPKNQRPELWNLYNTRKKSDESIRVFPLSNWTELDIWQYIYQENIPVIPLYYAKPRPVVIRREMIMLVDDDRCRLLPGEEIQIRKVRFRTLGCYPLTGAIESDAETIEDILLELIQARQSERQGRKIDTDRSGSMEKKKQEGYF